MKYFISMSLELWESLQTNLGFQMNKEPLDPGCIGFLPVFNSYEEAKTAYPGREVMEIETNETD